MRDKNLSLFNFEKSLTKVLERKLELIKILRTAVIDDPTFQSENFFIFPKKLYLIRGLCIVVHFLEDKWKYIFILELEERIKQFSLKEQLELKILLSSKENMLKFLLLSQRYTSHEVFGNLVQHGTKALCQIKIIRKSNKVVYPVWKRGYDDKGSLRSVDKWLPDFDWSLRDYHLKLEKEKYLHNKSLNRILVYLEKIVLDKEEDE